MSYLAKKDWLKAEVCLSAIYLITVISLITVGIRFHSEYSGQGDYLFWIVVGILLLPWSIISGYLAAASTHAGDFSVAQTSLFIDGCLNAFLLYFIVKWVKVVLI